MKSEGLEMASQHEQRGRWGISRKSEGSQGQRSAVAVHGWCKEKPPTAPVAKRAGAVPIPQAVNFGVTGGLTLDAKRHWRMDCREQSQDLETPTEEIFGFVPDSIGATTELQVHSYPVRIPA